MNSARRCVFGCTFGLALTAFLTADASATSVTVFAPSFAGDGVWFASDVREGGTVSTEDLTGQGGNLEGNAPLPTGAAKLTTGASNNDKAEVAVTGNFGTIAEFLNGGSLAYDYFKQSAGDLNGSAAAAIKMTILDTNTAQADGFTTFVYEPTWNVGTPGTSVAVPTDDWFTGTVTGNSGVLWHTGLYGAANQAGFGGDANTLQDWVNFFGDDLLDATIIALSIGVGTFNQGQTAFFDNVRFSSEGIDLEYDFEVTPVPLPGALPLLAGGLVLFGVMGWRRRRTVEA